MRWKLSRLREDLSSWFMTEYSRSNWYLLKRSRFSLEKETSTTSMSTKMTTLLKWWTNLLAAMTEYKRLVASKKNSASQLLRVSKRILLTLHRLKRWNVLSTLSQKPVLLQKSSLSTNNSRNHWPMLQKSIHLISTLSILSELWWLISEISPRFPKIHKNLSLLYRFFTETRVL